VGIGWGSGTVGIGVAGSGWLGIWVKSSVALMGKQLPKTIENKKTFQTFIFIGNKKGVSKV
jgi:hypothetical protein